jgi:hypothetical protein
MRSWVLERSEVLVRLREDAAAHMIFLAAAPCSCSPRSSSCDSVDWVASSVRSRRHVHCLEVKDRLRRAD